ncbi:MAG: hypothetical protein JWP18_1369 [Solirubrobacterales bacterium]|nr:hypothetical protein [Solirubrobacterales bacterium]
MTDQAPDDDLHLGTPGDDLHLGDEAAKLPGAPAIAGEGENICSTCGGSGEKDGATCPECGGKGIVIETIAGG